jgi:predicted ATPase
MKAVHEILAMSYYPRFAELVNQALTRLDRPPSWLARRLGINQSTVSRWLSHGTRPGDPETVVRIADILGILSQTQELLAAAGYGYVQQVDPNAAESRLDSAPDQNQSTATAGEESSQSTAAPNNLPADLTSFIGRHNELAQIAGYLADPIRRLLNIIGPGGIGKTRLALAVAKATLETHRFPDGIFIVPLAPLTSSEQVIPAVAKAIQYPLERSGEVAARSESKQILDFLATKKILLILDNLEHLPESVGLIDDILTATLSTKIIVTSRERIGLPGEQAIPLQGLDYSEEGTAAEPTSLSAIQIFLECARRHRPHIAASPEELQAILQICRFVEGMPLAIELAAAWVDTLSPGEIWVELRRSVEFLSAISLNVPERHRSMQVVFDATWQRLAPSEQEAFAQLSIFRGGFAQEAASQVANLSLPMLRKLVAHSLIQFEPSIRRYRIHELLRQFGERACQESSDHYVAVQERHSRYHCAMLAQSTGSLQGESQQYTLALLDQKCENLRAAWEWAVDRGSLPSLSSAMDALGYFYEWTGRYDEG